MIREANKIDNAVHCFLKRFEIVADDSLAVAFSGGADSLSLLLSLSRVHPNVIAIYVNHHLRSEAELDREIELNRSNSEKLGIGLVVLDADRSEIDALARSMGIEGAAREVRYRLIGDYCESNGISRILTAHNRDDCDESDIINFFRGGNLSRSIEERIGNIYRPLLSITHAENEEHVKSSGFAFSQDSTNLQDDALRTSIRHRLRPVLDEVFPSYGNALAQRRKCRESQIARPDMAHDAIFSAFTLLGYRNSNNNRISRKSIDGIMDLACNGSNSGRLMQGDVVILHRKGDLLFLNRSDSASESWRICIENEGVFDIPHGGRAIVSTVKVAFIRDSLPKMPSDFVAVVKKSFDMRSARLDDAILFDGKVRTVKELMKKKQLSAELLRQVRILDRNNEVIAVVFDGLDAKPFVADSENIAHFSDEYEMFLVAFV
ncbi:MAG TPA: tRNA lysidine(34) synthetase TilS [Spirochaetaceae bacterium]|nr:tRNA lysidine(34) synthetase TilS [Spirochaetaceae bacterium]